MGILLALSYSLLFVFIIYKLNFFRIEGISSLTLSILFLLKVVCGFALILIYTYYYGNRETGDVFKYFDDGNILFNAIYTNPLDYLKMLFGFDSGAEYHAKFYSEMNYWYKEFNYDLYNDNRTLIRINAFFRLFSFGYIQVHSIFMSFLSFIGLTAMFKSFQKHFQSRIIFLLFAIYLVPSVLFWSSGNLKEGIVIFSAGVFFYNFKIMNNGTMSIKLILLFFITGFLLFLTKFYVLFALIPGLITYTWIIRSNSKYSFLKFVITHTVLYLLFANSQYFTGYNLLETMCNKQHDFVQWIDSNPGQTGSLINLNTLEPSTYSILRNSPAAFFNSLQRPHFLEVHSPIVLLSALENLLILALIIVSLIWRRRYHEINKPMLYFGISFVVVLFVLCGLTTPVLGALVRYRVPALPFLFVVLFLVFDERKSLLFLKKIKKKLQ